MLTVFSFYGKQWLIANYCQGTNTEQHENESSLNWTEAGVVINLFRWLLPALTPPPPSQRPPSMFQGGDTRKWNPASQCVFTCVCYYIALMEQSILTLWKANQMNNIRVLVDYCVGKIKGCSYCSSATVWSCICMLEEVCILVCAHTYRHYQLRIRVSRILQYVI